MRHLYIFIALLLVLAGCSTNRNTARAEVRLNSSSQQLIVASVSGSMPVSEWLDTKSRQDLVDIQSHYLKKAQQATTAKESQEWLDLASQVSGGGSTIAALINASSYRMVILDGPYAGITLEPGQSSQPARVPVGILTFRALSASSIGQDICVTVSRQVSTGDKAVVLVNKIYQH